MCGGQLLPLSTMQRFDQAGKVGGSGERFQFGGRTDELSARCGKPVRFCECVLLLLRCKLRLRDECLRQENEVILELIDVCPDGRHKLIRSRYENWLAPNLASQIMHERNPCLAIDIWVRTEICLSVTRTEPGLLWISVESTRIHSSPQQISHQVDTRLKRASYDGRRPVLFGSLGIRSKASS